MVSQNNLVIQNDLQTIVTVDDGTLSRDIKRNPTLQADIHQEMSAPQSSVGSNYYPEKPVEYESGNESVGSTNQQTNTQREANIISHPIELTGSPEWDFDESIPPGNSYSPTNLGQYLHTQGFLTSDRSQKDGVQVTEI